MTGRPELTTATSFADLNRLLDELVSSVRAILGANLVGAYLQGSFALGDADAHSDVDFVIVAAGAVSDAQLRGLQAMHRRIHAQAVPWAQHLEGSYIPRRGLHRVDPARHPFPYLDNGADQLVRDPHCNTAVVRWILREHGVVLLGPQPVTLVAPVSPDDLRREARGALLEYGAWAREPGALGVMSQWKQTYLVVTFCRILHTLATGTVGSKREAAAWALANLPPAWHGAHRARGGGPRRSLGSGPPPGGPQARHQNPRVRGPRSRRDAQLHASASLEQTLGGSSRRELAVRLYRRPT